MLKYISYDFYNELEVIDFSAFDISKIKDNDMFDYIYNFSPQTIKQYINSLKMIYQRPDYHPEGDVYTHTKTVVNRIASTKNIDLIIAAYMHDTGKDRTHKIIKGTIMHPGHADYSSQLLNIGSPWRQWVRKLGGKPSTVRYIISNHTKMKELNTNNKSKLWYQSLNKEYKKYFDLFSEFDKGGFI